MSEALQAKVADESTYVVKLLSQPGCEHACFLSLSRVEGLDEEPFLAGVGSRTFIIEGQDISVIAFRLCVTSMTYRLDPQRAELRRRFDRPRTRLQMPSPVPMANLTELRSLLAVVRPLTC